MNDIGVVEYSKNTEKNCITAKWFFLNDGRKVFCTGAATGELKENYNGEYIVIYDLPDGSKSKPYNLIITKAVNHYELEWYSNGVKEYFGVGFEYDGKLFAGYRRYIKD